MKALTSPIAAALFATIIVTPISAQVPLGGMVTGNDLDRIQEIAAAYGPVERREEGGSTWLRGEMDETLYSITLMNCDDNGGNCTTLQFRAWWESDGAHSMESMNQWNVNRRFSAAYLDDAGNATIEFDVNLAHGVSAINFDDTVQWWEVVLRQFREEVIDPGYEARNAGAARPPSPPSKG